MRLISTAEKRNSISEKRNQARFKFEFCPDWIDQPGNLDNSIIDKLIKNIQLAKKIGIRQLWINPIITQDEKSPSETVESKNKTANLVLGPDYRKCTRKANLDFENINGVWYLLYFE